VTDGKNYNTQSSANTRPYFLSLENAHINKHHKKNKK
jgi:hypothetical protein